MAINGIVPVTVSFTDSSIGEELVYVWNFGDGSTSGDQNPTHTYNNAGTYSVSLTVTNSDGTDTKSDTVVVLPPDLGGNGNGEDFPELPDNGTGETPPGPPGNGNDNGNQSGPGFEPEL